MEQKIASLAESVIKPLGFEVVQVIIRKSGFESKTVEILVEKQNQDSIGVEDCKMISRDISAVLDVEDILPERYFLEVSSAGIERPLVKLQDYQRFCGREAKIRLKTSIQDKLSFRGRIVAVDGEEVVMEGEHGKLQCGFDNIKNGRLVMTEEMFKKILNKK